MPIPSLAKTHSRGLLKLASGELNVEITSNPYTLVFKSSTKTLTTAGYKHQGLFDIPSQWACNTASNTSCLANDPNSNPVPATSPPILRYINSEFTISPGELFYGFGERFGAFVKNGVL